MKKIIWILLLSGICHYAIAAQKYQKQNQQLLRFLRCEPTMRVFKQSNMILGQTNTHAKKKQLYLIQNKSQHTVILDFPAGHTGASAGLMQKLAPKQWQGYLYVQNQKHPISWTCYTQQNKIVSCKQKFFVCQIPYHIQTLKQSNSIVHQRLLIYLGTQNKSWWISDPKNSLLNIFLQGYQISKE